MSNFIQGYCRIKDGNAIVNGNYFFSSPASLSDFLEQLYLHMKLNYPKFYKMDNLSKLGVLSSEILLRNVDVSRTNAFDISVVLSNASSSLETDKNYFDSSKKVASPALFVYTLPNIVNGEISIRHGFKGESSFFVTPEFDPQLLCVYSDELLKEKSKLCLTGWVETKGDRTECFLYLVGIDATGLNRAHNVENIKSLYSA